MFLSILKISYRFADCTDWFQSFYWSHLGMVLTEQNAFEIYRCKLDLTLPATFESSLQPLQLRIRGQSTPVAKRFGVSPKTVRDIWSRRTWSSVTAPLWGQDTDSTFLVRVHLMLTYTSSPITFVLHC
jgi:hypothetical protein